MEFGGVSQTLGPFVVSLDMPLSFQDWVELYYPSTLHQKYVGDINSIELAILERQATQSRPQELVVRLLGFDDIPHAVYQWPEGHALAGTEAATVAEVLAEIHKRGLRPLTGYEGLVFGTHTNMLPSEPLAILCLGGPVETPDGRTLALKLNLDPERRLESHWNGAGAWDTSIPCWTHYHFAACEVD